MIDLVSVLKYIEQKQQRRIAEMEKNLRLYGGYFKHTISHDLLRLAISFDQFKIDLILFFISLIETRK